MQASDWTASDNTGFKESNSFTKNQTRHLKKKKKKSTWQQWPTVSVRGSVTERPAGSSKVPGDGWSLVPADIKDLLGEADKIMILKLFIFHAFLLCWLHPC